MQPLTTLSKERTKEITRCSFTCITLDESVDMDARARAPCIKHHGVEDAAVVGWAVETGKNPVEAVGQTQERRSDLGPAQPCQQDQEEKWPHGERHRRSGESP